MAVAPMKGLASAVAFLTPLGGARAPDPAAFSWFPVVGAALGLVLGGSWRLAGVAWPPLVAAAVVVALDLALTGLLHVDGLVDAADGLLPHLPAERRLEVMAEPTVGAFGIAVGGVALLLRWSALAVVVPSALLLAAIWCASRTSMAMAALSFPYARSGGGLASAFLTGAPRRAPLGVGVLASVVLGAAWSVRAGPLVVASVFGAAAGVVLLARRRIGGFTGDVLGAAGVVGETAGLLVASARWS